MTKSSFEILTQLCEYLSDLALQSSALKRISALHVKCVTTASP